LEILQEYFSFSSDTTRYGEIGMDLGLDYDGTYTLDPDFWNDFIFMAEDQGHTVYIVTNRKGDEDDQEVYDVPVAEGRVIFTGGKSKHDYMMANHDLHIDVWIDNEPEWIKENKIE
jgi:hypothetical protein